MSDVTDRHEDTERAAVEPASPETPASPSTPAGKPRAIGLRIAFLLVSIAGLAASVELIRLHVKAHTKPDEQSFCSMHAKVDCLSVAESPWALFLGVPVAAWATLAFGLLIVGTVVLLRRQRQGVGGAGARGDTLAGVTFVLSAVAVGVAALMAFVSHVVIGSLCLVCAALYVVNTVLFVVAWRICVRHGGIRRAIRADLSAARARLGHTFLVVTGLLAMAGGLMVVYPTYWRFSEPVGPGDLAHGHSEEGHPWIGAKKPELTIHEFSDYQCGFCRRFNASLREILRKEDIRGKVRLIHYHYPLDSSCNDTVPAEMRTRSCELARAAVCAGKQGKFWHMNDMMFTRRRPGGPAVLGLAGKLHLDMVRFRRCMDSAEAHQQVKNDIALGEAMSRRVTGQGISGTPTYFFERPGQEPRAARPNERSIRMALEELPQQYGPGRLSHGITTDGLPWIGATVPRVTIYEVSDYTCFYCLRGHVLTRQLLEDPAIGSHARLVHVQYPFDSDCNPAFETRQHPNACALARAAICGAAQGRFWEMNDLIFRAAAQGRIPPLPALGQRLRLDRASYAACIASPDTKEALIEEIRAGERIGAQDKKGIDGIPSYFHQVGDGPIRRSEGRPERPWLLTRIAEAAAPAGADVKGSARQPDRPTADGPSVVSPREENP